MEPIYEYKRIGYEITLYPNRITISKKRGILPTKEDTVFLRNIVSLDVNRLSRSLILRTNDGYITRVEIFGKDAEELRAHLESLL